MPFVKLDGVTIRVRDDGSKLKTEEIGTSGRVVGGSYQRTARVFKRAWFLKTTALEAQDAQRVSEFLRARGQAFRFVDANSEGGLAPVAGVYTLRGISGGGGTSPTPILNESKFGGAVAVDLSTTNLFSDNVASGTDTLSNTTGFASVDGATLLSDTIRYISGARSLSIETATGVNGVRGGVSTSPIAALAATVYTASFYLMNRPGTSPQPLRAYLSDIANGITGSIVTVTPLDEIWSRVVCQITTGALATTLALYVLEDVADQGARFLLDNLQLEARTHATSWVLPSTPRAGGVLRYSAGALRHFPIDGAFTALAWVRRPDLAVGIVGDPGTRAIFDIRQTVANPPETVNSLRVKTLGNGSDALQFQTKPGQRPSIGDVISGGSMSDPLAWYHVVVVVRPHPKTGEHKKELWLDGVLVAFSDPTQPLPSAAYATEFSIGGDQVPDSRPWSGGEIADLAFLPFDASPSMIASFYASGLPQARAPRHLLEGSMLEPEDSCEVAATVDSERYQTYAGAPNARAITFDLEEV